MHSLKYIRPQNQKIEYFEGYLQLRQLILKKYHQESNLLFYIWVTNSKLEKVLLSI